MSETPSTPSQIPSPAPLLPRGPLLLAIADETRWQILRELAPGEPRMVTEIARSIGRSENSTSKHLAVLRGAGIVQIVRGRMQQLRPQFIADAEARILDFGYLQIRLNVGQP